MNDKPYFRRFSSNDKGVSGRKAETNLSKRLGVNQQPGSGALTSAKGDLKADSFLIESKTTINDSVSLTRDWLTKIKYEARDMDKHPALAFSFVNGDGTPKPYGSWVAIEESVFQKIMDILDEVD